jgi:isoquinoline 1-oxidoreductase subunit beta
MQDPARRVSPAVSRREFIRIAAAAGGGLALSLELHAQEGLPFRPQRPGPPRSPFAFIEIAADDSITFVSPAVEMGQGGHTSMPIIFMNELGGEWSRLKVVDAPAAAVYRNPLMGQQATVGSFSVRGWYTAMRRLGAAAREMLVEAAASGWKVPASECTVSGSRIHHAASGRSLSFGSVAARAARLPVPQHPALKPARDFTLIGTSPQRVDVADKVDGSARYGIDVRLPGMLYAAIKACPTLGGKIRSCDDAAAKRVSGYHATVPLAEAVVIVARSYWQARKALDLVKLDYDLGPLASLDSSDVSRRLRAGITEPGTAARQEGDVEKALAQAASRLEAVYEVPYLAHACMEPMNCTASVSARGCDVWCGTQNPQAAQATAAKVLGISPERVKVHTQYLGGGFGRRGQADFVAQAVAASKAVGRPVKLVWSREEDIQHDFYRPAAAIRFRAGVDAAGRLIALDCNVATASAPSFGPGEAGPAFYTGGVADTSYSIPNFRVTGVNKNIGVRFGFWRSVNDSHNPFMLEGFIDEVARHVKQDPYRFRRSMLLHRSARRQLALLDLLARESGWGRARPGRFLGITAFGAFGSFVGATAEVSVKGKAVTLHRVAMGIDCGTAVDPRNIKHQLSGGMVYGLSAALREQITFEHGAVQQHNFDDFPVLMLSEMPRTDCYIMPSAAPPGGVGEPGTAPIAPALANAIYAATGTRARELPLTKLGYTYSSARV